jgi:cytochrome c peroxidase
VMLYDKDLSVYRNEACAFCHMPETGFTGPVSELNRTTGAYPGSVRTRFSDRKPQSHAYAPLSPVLHYNPGQGDVVGGNFWDMRATGRRLGNPAAEQAQGPPTNPVEMGLPDIDRLLRSLGRGDVVHLEVRCGVRKKSAVYAARAAGRRPVSLQGAMQRVPPRRRTRRRPTIHRLHREQYRHSC